MMSLLNTDIFTLNKKLKNREVTCTELITETFNNIHKSKLNSYITLMEESALNKASLIDKNSDFSHLLTGLPIAIKDNICIRNFPTTCGSKILKNFIPPYNATVIDKLESLNAIFIGKTNLDEFAMGSSTENSAFNPTLNPYNPNLVPGGSSGGSASSVKANESICALGSDTGGSIRQPAAFCGVVGLKPTYGLVSRYGLVAFASSLDQIGPITKCAKDSAILLDAIAGEDPKDSTSRNSAQTGQYFKSLNPEIKNIKIGIPKEYFVEGIAPEIKEKILSTAKLMEKSGAVLYDISLPNTEYAIAIYYLIATAEASSNLARYDGVKYGYRIPESENLKTMYEFTKEQGFGKEVKRRIMLGTFGLQSGYYDEYYNKACKVRNLIALDFENAFKKVDIILTPATPTLPFKIGERITDPLQMYLSDIFTVSVNLAGLPAISFKCGEHNDLPVGVQLIGKPFSEQMLLNTTYAYEQITEI